MFIAAVSCAINFVYTSASFEKVSNHVYYEQEQSQRHMHFLDLNHETAQHNACWETSLNYTMFTLKGTLEDMFTLSEH